MKMQTVSTRIPADLVGALDAVCRKLGLRKNHVLASALREKLEDLLDGEDLREAMREATGFHAWTQVKEQTLRKGRS